MTFGAPQWLWGLLLIPILIALFIRAEQRGLRRLQEFVSARLLPQLAGTVNRPRRIVRFGMLLLGLSLALASLAQPRWGYTFEDVKRKGLDLLIAIDTSRSMLSNDVQPNRIERVKLATQDLINELQGDRVGLIAFAGRAFLQAPLTIDYEAVMESINDLNTQTIPEGGTNISSAIDLATQSFGKSAVGNRALIIFTDGEELTGDAVKAAKAAADEGVRIFTVGVGTPQGSLIPITSENGEMAFVKDSAGQVVKSKLDEKPLHEIAQATGGFYVHLENGPRTMQQIYNEGLAKMQAAEIDVRLSRRPIERYEWPLGAAVIALALSILIGERKSATGRIRRGERVRERNYVPSPVKAIPKTVWIALAICCCQIAYATTSGVKAYQDGKFEDAYSQFQETLKAHPQSRAEDKLQFDSGTAAYKLKDYSKALESFSQALLSRDTGLQSKSHYNLGNTLYQRGEVQKNDEKKLSDWTDALNHYEQTLKAEPQNKEAKENYDYVKKKIEELKNKKQPEQQPSPSPSPPQKDKQDKQNQQSGSGGQNQKQQDHQQQQQQQSQDQSGSGKDQQNQKKDDQSQANNEQQKSEQPKAGESPSPSPNEEKQGDQQQKGEGEESSPTPGPESTPPDTGQEQNGNEQPSPSPGEGENAGPSATPAESPQKEFAGEVKGAGEEKPQKPPDKDAQPSEAEVEKQGQMSERLAEALLESMIDEVARVQLNERRAARRVYKDW
jgi:Ca-activated chloride channel family protein